ncbi:hypothetical protein Vadar_027447 [Vaccinium darrowii]|uniref:Uncharacterized protein n=1 Tax=Vaccinium darrowii TaxID=229202 RepID=A0ACB7XV30_9ERIC|nr:hypothetical protein Vadar_027447 [Vaccinium darrowii]
MRHSLQECRSIHDRICNCSNLDLTFSGFCALKFSAAKSILSMSVIDCWASFPPYLADVVCCSQFDAALVILIGQSNKYSGELALNPTHAMHCLSDIEQIQVCIEPLSTIDDFRTIVLRWLSLILPLSKLKCVSIPLLFPLSNPCTHPRSKHILRVLFYVARKDLLWYYWIEPSYNGLDNFELLFLRNSNANCQLVDLDLS